ncbi:MAG: aldolase/citrate lyase family protein [Planctomycetaceae bacterium]|jgi:4-hydroxy-2-oxoheptanedioate aldolase|nr:aldolase/citrate lyase family protein [Planctomycetaceae bacterium]
MRTSKLLSKIRSGKVAQVCALGHFIPSYVCHAAHFGFDAIWLDCEHRAWSDRELQSMLAYFHQYDIDCMLRTPTLEKAKLYRYLEDGATGLMIPHVSTPERARELVQAVKFPPIGDRGLDGSGLDSEFHLSGGDSYTDDANRETFLVVQIETPEAMENVEAIAAVEGVDGLFMGPGDLGLRIKKLNPGFTLDEARTKLAAACKKHGKAWGLPAADEAHLKQFAEEGAQILAQGGEFMALKEMLENVSQRFDRAVE